MKADTAEERRDYTIKHAHFRVQRCGGNLRIDSSLEGHEAEILIHTDCKPLHDENDGVRMSLKTHCGGIESGEAQTTLTPEQARDVAQRLTEAAERYEKGEDYYER